MKCLNCSYINPDDARFCQNCGRPLERACPVCATPNPPSARFCKNCGTNLQEPADGQTRKQEPGQGTTIPHTGAPVREAAPARPRTPEHTAGERRIVTAVFADVVGSTTLAEQMDPEDWTAVMNRAFEVLTPLIHRYEGTIARLMGDAILAFFGAPVAHEDDPRRAGHAALDMIQASREYAEEMRAEYGIDFAIRVGMNTGMAVVGEVGSNLASEYTAMGDAVNLAARIQTAARPMTVLVSEHTYRLIAADFEWTDLGSIPIRGKAEPVHVYELQKARYQAGRPWAGEGIRSALVGRDSELAVLYKAGEAVLAGLGRVALVTGDPGIGKTRLIEEWKMRLAGQFNPAGKALRWAEGHTLSYGQGMAYHLLVDLVYSLAGVQRGSDEAAIRTALSDLCTSLFGEKAVEVYPYLGHLLSLQLDDEALERVRLLDPQALQGQYLASLREMLRKLAEEGPVGVLLEDIHWADPSSVDLITKLLPLAFEAPILFCLVTRIDRQAPGWKLVVQVREQLGGSLIEIPLHSLSEEDTWRMVSNLLQEDELPEDVRRLVLGRAEGNPLFVEEVVRMLLDRKLLEHTEAGWRLTRDVETVDIPDNLQSLLLARIDRLPDDVKHTLRVAAVIGRQFSIRVLQEVLKRQEEMA